MSLSRTALRLATMEALRPTAAAQTNGPWPTLAGGNVFDSRLDPISDLSPQTMRPTLAVYTEHDDGDPDSQGTDRLRRIVDLTIEIAMVARIDDGADPAVYEAGVPETDSELEASLDLLEAQVRFALVYGDTGALWRKLLTGERMIDARSSPHRTAEERARLAMRTLSMKVQILDDCYTPVPAAAPVGISRLPQPLRGIIEKLAATSYGKKIGEGLAAQAPVHAVAVPLKTVAMDIDVADPQGQRDGAADVTAEVTNLDQ